MVLLKAELNSILRTTKIQTDLPDKQFKFHDVAFPTVEYNLFHLSLCIEPWHTTFLWHNG